MFDFVVIDFETANNNLNSACSIGLVAVKDLEIVSKEYFLIKPPTGTTFRPENIDIHGITPEQVDNQPFFNEIWENIKHYFSNEILVAHNASFDMSVLKNCLSTYNISFPEFIYLDSISISTKACNSSVGKKLTDRADFFGITIDNHHNALCDAEIAAKLVICTVINKKRKSFQAFYNVSCSNNMRKSFSDLKAGTVFGEGKRPSSRFQKININEISATTERIDISNPFYQKQCVFTGELNSMDRENAMQKIVNLGGIIKSGVSRKTDFLIVGKQDKELVGDDGMSTKEEKAYELIKNGYSIKIINESEFLFLLNDMRSC